MAGMVCSMHRTALPVLFGFEVRPSGTTTDGHLLGGSPVLIPGWGEGVHVLYRRGKPSHRCPRNNTEHCMDWCRRMWQQQQQQQWYCRRIHSVVRCHHQRRGRPAWKREGQQAQHSTADANQALMVNRTGLTHSLTHSMRPSPFGRSAKAADNLLNKNEEDRHGRGWRVFPEDINLQTSIHAYRHAYMHRCAIRIPRSRSSDPMYSHRK